MRYFFIFTVLIFVQQLGFVSSVESALPSANLIGHWPLNDGSGSTAIDLSSTANDAIFVDLPVWSTGLSGNGALTFDGVNDYLNISGDPAYDNLTQFSISAWVHRNSDTGAIFAKNAFQSSIREFYFGVFTGNYLRLNMSADGSSVAADLISGNTIPLGVWTHVATTWDGTEMKLFINGVLEASTVYAGTMFAGTTSDLQIGGYKRSTAGSPTDYLDSGIMEVSFYSIALLDSEITDIYNILAPKPYSISEVVTFTPPTSLFRGDASANTVLQFEITAGANTENIDGFTVDITGDINDLNDYEIVNVTNSPYSVYGGNVSTGNVNSGNIEFLGSPFAISAGNTETFELVIHVNPTTTLGNILFTMDHASIASSNTLAGNAFNSGLISFQSRPLSVVGLTPSNGSTNVAVDSNLIMTFAESVDLAAGNLLLYENNVLTEVLAFSSLNNAGNVIEFDPVSNFSPGANVMIQMDNGLFLGNASGDVFGGFLADEWSFVIDHSTTVEGLSFGAGPAGEPTSFNEGDASVALIDNRVQLANGSSYEVITSMNINFQQGVIGTDIDQIKVGVAGNILGTLNMGSTTSAENTSLWIPINNTTDLSIYADILTGTTSGNLQYTVSGNDISLAGGNLMVAPAPNNANFGYIVSSVVAIHPEASFTPPTSVSTGNTQTILSFNVFSPVNTVFDSITFDVLSGSSADLVDLQLWSTSFGDYFLSYGSMVGGNILFSGNGTQFFASNNLNFEIRANIPDPKTQNSFELAVDPTNSMAVSFGSGSQPVDGSIIGTGLINITDGASMGSGFQLSRAAAGRAAFLLVNSSGNLLTQGRNNFRQLGRDGDASTPSPIAVGNIISIEMGEAHALALLDDGNVISWGSNIHGQALNNLPTLETGLPSGVVAIETGSHNSFVITDNNQLWAKGRNSMGQLGLGSTVDTFHWTQVSLPAGNIQKVSSGVEHTGVLIDGMLYGFGSNGFGQLAQTGSGHYSTWVVVNSSPIWTDFEAGGFHSMAIDNTGNLWAGGKNSFGQLGLGTLSTEINPPQSSGLSNVVDIAGGYEHSIVITENSGNTTVYVAGSNRLGQLNIAGSSIVSTFSPMDNNITNAVEVDAGPYTSLIFNSDGLLLGSGQLGEEIKLGLEILLDLSVP